MLFRDLVQLDWEAADQTEVFERMADILFKKGFVKDTYLESLKAREESYPTANNDEVHPVRFIFMLGFLKSDEHIDLLQILVENFQNEELMERLNNARTAEEYFELVCGINGMDS